MAEWRDAHLHPTHHTLRPTLYALHPYTHHLRPLQPPAYTLNAPAEEGGEPSTLHPPPDTQRPLPHYPLHTLHFTPRQSHPALCTLAHPPSESLRRKVTLQPFTLFPPPHPLTQKSTPHAPHPTPPIHPALHTLTYPPSKSLRKVSL